MGTLVACQRPPAAIFQPRAIIGANSLEPVTESTEASLRQVAHTLARVEKKTNKLPLCTALRITKQLFMTSMHCIEDCEALQFTMGYERDIPAEERLSLDCTRLVTSSKTLDYAVYEAKKIEHVLDDRYPVSRLLNAMPMSETPAVLASHPHGRMQEIDQSEECKILSGKIYKDRTERQLIKHSCDTDGGSSGAPIFDRETLEVIALHAGEQKPANGGAVEFNVAIPMALIIEDLRDKLDDKTLEAMNL